MRENVWSVPPVSRLAVGVPPADFSWTKLSPLQAKPVVVLARSMGSRWVPTAPRAPDQILIVEALRGAILPLRRGAIAQLGERLNGMQTPVSVVANRSPITIESSGIDQVIVCGGEAITN